MGCTHCMDDARPEGHDMNFDTFKDAIEFFNTYGGVECIITGGEPTENPEWDKMLEYALVNAKGSSDTRFCHVTLTTNGMNIADEDRTYYRARIASIISKYRDKLHVQVTHVPEYYPIKLDFKKYPIFESDRVCICDEIEYMYPQGRARDNNLPWNSKASKCFNIRSLVRQTKDLNQSVLTLNSMMKFCTPKIAWDGSIKLGESKLCPTVASIYDDPKDIVEKICNFRCSGCDIINKNLPDMYLKAIGEK